jgi:hypothetical protein
MPITIATPWSSVYASTIFFSSASLSASRAPVTSAGAACENVEMMAS